METRITRYSQLRAKIDREIQLIYSQTENDRKLIYFKNLVDRVDKKIYQEAEQLTLNEFPDFNVFIKENALDKKNILDEKKWKINKWIDVISKMENNFQTKSLSDYVPDLDNEKFLLETVEKWNHLDLKRKKKFQEMIKSKKNFLKIVKNDKSLKKVPSEINDLLRITNLSKSNLNKYSDNFAKLIDKKRNKSKSIALLAIALLFLQIFALLGFFLIKN